MADSAIASVILTAAARARIANSELLGPPRSRTGALGLHQLGAGRQGVPACADRLRCPQGAAGAFTRFEYFVLPVHHIPPDPGVWSNGAELGPGGRPGSLRLSTDRDDHRRFWNVGPTSAMSLLLRPSLDRRTEADGIWAGTPNHRSQSGGECHAMGRWIRDRPASPR